MGNTLRCCIACMLPCGALDVVRIVHVNGYVEELSRTVKAEEVMKANPKHVIRKSNCQGIVHRIVVLPPDAELRRGNIYFLIPTSCLKEKEPKAEKEKKLFASSSSSSSSAHNGNFEVSSRRNPSARRRNRREHSAQDAEPPSRHGSSQRRSAVKIKQGSQLTELVISEQYLADVLSEKAQHESVRAGRHSRKNSRVGVWRPHLESISEVASM